MVFNNKIAVALALYAVIDSVQAVKKVRHSFSNVLETDRELRKKQSKEGKGSGASAAPSVAPKYPACVAPAPALSTGKGGKKKGGKGKSCETSECLAPVMVVCGDTFTGEVTLSSDLKCVPFENGITMSGPNAVLDCAGFSISRALSPLEFFNFGILLEDGATAMNCEVSGFGDGVRMGDGDNVLKDSLTFGNNSDGVEIVGNGCQTVENVQSAFNVGAGIEVEGEGTVVLKSIVAISNGNDGINIPDLDGPLFMYLEDVTASLNGDNGMQVNDNEAMDIQFFGTTVFSNNDDDGLEGDASSSATYTFNDVVIITDNDDDGLDIDDGEIIVAAAGSTVIVCDNGDSDIDTDSSPFTLVVGAVVACGDNEAGLICADCTTALSSVAIAPTPMLPAFGPATACS
jgi:hypothetical protein